MKTCLGCGRVMYINDYCAICSKKHREEYFKELEKENPDQKPLIDMLLWKDQYMLEYKKQLNKERRQRYNHLYISEKLRAKVRSALKYKSEKRTPQRPFLIRYSTHFK